MAKIKTENTEEGEYFSSINDKEEALLIADILQEIGVFQRRIVAAQIEKWGLAAAAVAPNGETLRKAIMIVAAKRKMLAKKRVISDWMEQEKEVAAILDGGVFRIIGISDENLATTTADINYRGLRFDKFRLRYKAYKEGFSKKIGKSIDELRILGIETKRLVSLKYGYLEDYDEDSIYGVLTNKKGEDTHTFKVERSKMVSDLELIKGMPLKISSQNGKIIGVEVDTKEFKKKATTSTKFNELEKLFELNGDFPTLK